MNGRILQFEDHRHGQAQRLLPWLVNGRIDGDERAWVEQHVRECRECERELLALRELQLAVQADLSDDASLSSKVDDGWLRLRNRLRTMPARAEPFWQTLHRQWQQAPRWLAATAAIQAVALLMLGFALWRPPTTPASYRTLATTPSANAGNLVIVFDPRIEEARLTELLRASQARIVDGPNDAGAYVLAVAPARLAMVRDALRAAPGVTLVATLGPGPEQPGPKQ
jgi:hypothetical protein